MRGARVFQIVFVAVFFAMIVLPAANMAWPLFIQTPLNGVTESVKRPAISMADVRSERFQRDFTKWFDQNYGARPTASRLDNSLDVYVFRETRTDQPLKVGRNGVLFINDHINHYNRPENNVAGIEAFARKTRRAQDLLAEQGKFLIVVLIPSKVRFYPEAIPPEQVMRRPSPRPADKTVSDVAAAFARHGATMIDGLDVLERSVPPLERAAVYSLNGRHMNAPATCQLLEAAFAVARPRLQGVTIPHLDCNYVLSPGTALFVEELDLFRLLNVWGAMPTEPLPRMPPVAETVAESLRVDTLIAGSSFAWKEIEEAERNHTLGRTHLFFYNKTVVPRDGEPPHPVPPRQDEAWKKLVFGKKLFLLPTIEEYVPADNSEFLDDLIGGLEDDSARGATP